MSNRMLEMTEQAFRRTVAERTPGSNFVRALYQTLEEYQAAEQQQTAAPVD